MSSSRWVHVAAASLTLACAACGDGCSGSKASPAGTPSTSTSVVAAPPSGLPPIASGARARSAALQGNPAAALIQAARQGDLADAQKTKLDEIEKTLRPDEGLAREELKGYHADLVAGVRAGKLDNAKLDAHWATLEKAAKAHQAKESAALDALYASLDAKQRAAAVAKVRAAHADRDAIRGLGRPPSAGKAMLQKLSRDLDLDEEQKKKLASVASSKDDPKSDGNREQVRKHLDAVLAAFEKDGFDAKQIPPPDVKMSGGPIAEQAEIVGQLLPILKPDQREKLAVRMEKGGGPRHGHDRGRHDDE
ncbi:MAG: hypothetical protein JNL38_28365 [Myxococcales bacterium]|nr:hypothetical protein [Myxococcales bacterium]